MARRLADGLWLLDLGLVPPFATNCYLVDDGEAVTLIDAGLLINYPSLATELDRAGYERADIDRVLFTHYDIDHVGGARALRDHGVPMYMGERDVDLVTGAWDPNLVHHKGLFHRIARRLFPLAGHDLRPIADGETVGNFTAHHTPGHNPGHTVYTHEGLDAAFLGDLVWATDGEFTTPFWLDSYEMRAVRESAYAFARDHEFERGLAAHGEPVLTGAGDHLRAVTDEFW